MTRAVNEIETWYEAVAERGAPRPELRESIAADVCVVGGGLAGLTVAFELSRYGKSVALLEAKRVAWAASGRNGGFVSNGFALGTEEIAKRVGLESATALYRLSEQGAEYVREKIATLDPRVKMGDGLVVAFRHDNAGGVARRAELMRREFDRPIETMSVEQTRLILRTERYFQSLRDPAAFHIHPLRYALILAAEAERLGARLFEASQALAIEPQGTGYLIRTTGGAVKAGTVVHCVSALDRKLHPFSGGAVLPVATYVAVTRPMSQDAILTSSAVADTRRAGDYYRLIDGGRILWGGRITTRVNEPSRLGELMKGDMLSVFPQLGDPQIEYAWAGLMAYALHKMPLIGRSRDGQWYATGFGGHGLNTTAMAGILIARAIAEGDDEVRRFEAFGPRWAGGPLGRLGVQGSYWYMQLRDRLDEASAYPKGRQ